MTTKEKAKAYDMAIKKAMDLWNSPRTCFDIEQLKSIFPKLHESEDERIRKYLVEFINLSDNPKKVEMLAYLEKEKEQKQISWSELTWKDINTLERLINNVRYEFQNGISEESFGKAVLERFRESKGDDYVDDVEWSEEDKMVLNSAIFWLERTLTIEKAIDISTRDCSLSMNETLDKLKSLRPQPKQEWSEKDETYRNFILESLEDQIRFHKKDAEGAYHTKQIRAAQNWLKSRCPSLNGTARTCGGSNRRKQPI